jgi:hypothetical protein
MIDATQAAIVAYMTEHGEIIHDSHLIGAEVWDAAEQAARDRGQPVGQGWRVFDEVIEAAGYTPLIRYSIHEIESSNWEDLPYQGIGVEDLAVMTDYGDEPNVNYEDETVLVDGEWVDVAPYVGVYCDECGERIE